MHKVVISCAVGKFVDAFLRNFIPIGWFNLRPNKIDELFFFTILFTLFLFLVFPVGLRSPQSPAEVFALGPPEDSLYTTFCDLGLLDGVLGAPG